MRVIRFHLAFPDVEDVPFELGITAQSGGDVYQGGDPLVEGADLILTCGGEASVAVNYSWDFSSLVDFSPVPIGQSQLFTKYNLHVEDSGEYTCTARWEQHVIQMSIAVDVHATSEGSQIGGSAAQRSEAENSTVIIVLCVLLVIAAAVGIAFAVYKFRKEFQVEDDGEYSSFNLPV